MGTANPPNLGINEIQVQTTQQLSVYGYIAIRITMMPYRPMKAIQVLGCQPVPTFQPSSCIRPNRLHILRFFLLIVLL